jgi:hypothetical protein
MSAAEKSLHES